MTRIFISHKHSDEKIAYKLSDFFITALNLKDEDILCTSDPDSGLSFNSNTISDQLKSNLKEADALVAVITADSLRSPWIPFEIGSFWPTEKSIILILGPSLTPDNLPGPLKGWLSISIENDKAFEQLNKVINQLDKELDIRQNINRSRRDRHLTDFLIQFRAWKSQLPPIDTSQQEQIEQLNDQIKEFKKSHQSLQQRLEEKENETNHLRETNNNQQQEKQQIEESLQSRIDELNHQLEQNKIQSQSDQKKLNEKESITSQLKEQLQQLKISSKSNKNTEPELKSEKGIDYSRLRNLLAAEKWKEADQETSNVMLQAAGQKQGWLDTDDINKFPCEDLRTINQLWLYFSDGKFGFSVQKEIYLSLGGTRDYDQKIWEKFGDRVGWRKGGEWLDYYDLNFDKTAQEAHLPLAPLVIKTAQEAHLPISTQLHLKIIRFLATWLRVSLLSRKDL